MKPVVTPVTMLASSERIRPCSARTFGSSESRVHQEVPVLAHHVNRVRQRPGSFHRDGPRTVIALRADVDVHARRNRNGESSNS